MAPPLPVDVRAQLPPEEFYADYVNNKPVLLKGALAGLPAAARWSLQYFGSVAPDLDVRLKTGRVADGITKTMRLADYCRDVAEWERSDQAGDPPGYLHDVPLLSLVPQLRRDLEPFPTALFPPFFAKQWWVFPQFFVGPSRSQTPLHFDTLLTHNLFFQLDGGKRFVMVDAADRDRCYPYNWRWSPVDPDEPDLERFPRFRDVRTLECFVEDGDMLYMPPGTLHKVTSLSSSVSFNIDWHDPTSAIRGLTAARHRMPVQNLRYNLLFALGLCGVPLKALMPGLKSYFTYIS
jgi:hypothetical protein